MVIILRFQQCSTVDHDEECKQLAWFDACSFDSGIFCGFTAVDSPQTHVNEDTDRTD